MTHNRLALKKGFIIENWLVLKAKKFVKYLKEIY